MDLVVAHDFLDGKMNYRAGERYTLAQLGERGMTERTLDRLRRRNALLTPEDYRTMVSGEATAVEVAALERDGVMASHQPAPAGVPDDLV